MPATLDAPSKDTRGASPRFAPRSSARLAPTGRATPAAQAARAAPNAVAERKPGASPAGTRSADRPGSDKPDHPILFQSFFKSVGPRTYVAQVKQASNGNHYLVLTEGRRDKDSGEVRKLRINIFSEDFDAFFQLLRDTARYIKDHPLPPEFVAQRKAFWDKTKRPRKFNRKPASKSRD